MGNTDPLTLTFAPATVLPASCGAIIYSATVVRLPAAGAQTNLITYVLNPPTTGNGSLELYASGLQTGNFEVIVKAALFNDPSNFETTTLSVTVNP